ncbi:MAG: flagellar biosynthesis anti-sigma factor FlgM [Candidatus Riflebacteria bacterium]|nr:flagellar biosynthesis anti-sigma factor FlgM [Candidatus Riflebacteria bacterium]
MKVSNSIDVTKIYQEQVKKAGKTQSADAGKFDRIMAEAGAAKADSSKDVSSVKGTPVQGLKQEGPAKTQPRTRMETIHFAAEAVAVSPDVRTEKVDRIKALYEAGQYNVSPEAVAEKLWASGILTRSWEG